MKIDKERVATRCVCCGSDDLLKSPAILMPFVAARTFGWYPIEINDGWGLKTIQKGMAYSICNSLCCKNCSHLFLDIRFSDQEMSNLYRDYRGKDYVLLREFFEPGYTARNTRLNQGVSFLSEVEGFLKPYISMPSSILDWGGDTGLNTPFREIAKQIDIYDISDKSVIEGVRRVSLNEAVENKYELLICSQVLEHTPFPVDIINLMKQSMSSESCLYIELPCESLVRNSSESENLAIKKKHWHEHINFYTRKSIQALMNYCALDINALREVNVPMGEDSVHIYQVAAKLKRI